MHIYVQTYLATYIFPLQTFLIYFIFVCYMYVVHMYVVTLIPVGTHKGQ